MKPEEEEGAPDVIVCQPSDVHMEPAPGPPPRVAYRLEDIRRRLDGILRLVRSLTTELDALEAAQGRAAEIILARAGEEAGDGKP